MILILILKTKGAGYKSVNLTGIDQYFLVLRSGRIGKFISGTIKASSPFKVPCLSGLEGIDHSLPR